MPSRARSAGSRPKRYHHGDLKEELVRAALEILETQGIEGLTLRKVAQHADVSHAAPAHHFQDARGLFGAVAAEGYRALHEALVAAADRGRMTEGAVGALRAAGVAYVEFAAARASLFRVMFHPLVAKKSTLPQLEHWSSATFGVLLSGIETAQAAGQVRAGGARDLALACWSGVHGLAVLLVDDQVSAKGFLADPARLAGAVTDVLYLGMRPE
jgi:AcrR family transcriptional regulator